MMANQTRQPPPGGRLGFNRTPAARRGCALRSMNFCRGDVLLVPIPFSDLTHQKVRPARAAAGDGRWAEETLKS